MHTSRRIPRGRRWELKPLEGGVQVKLYLHSEMPAQGAARKAAQAFG